MPNALLLISHSDFFSKLFFSICNGNVLTPLLKRAELRLTLLNILSLIFQESSGYFSSGVALSGNPDCPSWWVNFSQKSDVHPVLWHRVLLLQPLTSTQVLGPTPSTVRNSIFLFVLMQEISVLPLCSL